RPAGRTQRGTGPRPPREAGRQALGGRSPADLARLQTTGDLGWAASPLQRAAATAHKLGAIAPRFDPRLVERHYGVWQGRPLAEVEASLENGGWESRPAGGETSGEVPAPVRPPLAPPPLPPPPPPR